LNLIKQLGGIMQTHGYIYDKSTGEKILILVRQASYYRNLKRRFAGEDGNHFDDEENFLNEKEQLERLERLKNGETISC